MSAASDDKNLVARIAGNLLSGRYPISPLQDAEAVTWAVRMARDIVDETIRSSQPAPRYQSGGAPPNQV